MPADAHTNTRTGVHRLATSATDPPPSDVPTLCHSATLPLCHSATLPLCTAAARYTRGGAMWENASSHTDTSRVQWVAQCEAFAREFFTFGKEQGCLVDGPGAAEAWLARIEEASERLDRRDRGFELAIPAESRSAREEAHARNTLRKGSVLNLRAPVSMGMPDGTPATTHCPTAPPPHRGTAAPRHCAPPPTSSPHCPPSSAIPPSLPPTACAPAARSLCARVTVFPTSDGRHRWA